MAAFLICHKAAGAEQNTGGHVVHLSGTGVTTLDRRIESIRGERTKPGEPFVIRIYAEAGYIIMPHTHPVDENIVVVKGSWALGMGDHFRRESLEPMEVGDYGFAARNMPHFAFSKTATILQVHGTGPLLVRWIVPVYELTDHGVLLKATAEDPGRLMPSAPQSCFVLNLGAQVRGNLGEGAIIGAQCTPGELTQYRIQKAHGERFWALSQDLRPAT
jgi:hypothetical protein